MKVLSRLTLFLAALAPFTPNAPLAADAFPTRPIRIIVTSAPGGLLDTTTRIVAQKMGEKLGQSVVVENHAGAGGLVAIREVKNAHADGYTLLATPKTVLIQQVLSLNSGYDVEKDFAAIGPMTRAPLLLVVAGDGQDRTLADLLARVKANPGKVTYGSAGTGTATHLGAASFAQSAGVNMLHVPYKGNPAAWPDVISGRVTVLFEPYGSGSSMIQSGKMRALGIASSTRLADLPEVPTFAEQGVPGVDADTWFALLAPSGTPKDVVQGLAGALRSALTSAELKERTRKEGQEVMLMSPEDFNRFAKEQLTTISRLVADLGLEKQ